MKQFFCPYCNEKLSHLEGTVVKMKGVLNCETFECSAIFYLPGSIGQYGTISDGHIKLFDGAKIDFRCTNSKCDKSYTTHHDDDLAEIKMIDDETNYEYVVVFNRVYGKHSTFVVDYKKKKIKDAFGEDKEIYIHDFDKSVNFFGE